MYQLLDICIFLAALAWWMMFTFHKPWSLAWNFRYVKMTRKVEIPSKSVSRLKAMVSFCVCFYAAYDIFAKQRYLAFADPVGTFRIRLKDPASALTFKTFEDAPYCGADGKTTCQWVDAVGASYGFQPGSIFITTRIQEKRQRKHCILSVGANCVRKKWKDIGKAPIFVAHIEDFRLAVAASVEFPDHQVTYAPESHEISVSDWLKMSGTTLDMLSDAISTKPGEDTFRHEGLVLVATLKYDNTGDKTPLLQWLAAAWGLLPLPPIKAKWSSKRILHKEFKETQLKFESNDSQTRTLWKRHGIFIQFESEALVGRFSTSNLLLTTMKTLGLLWICTTIVNQYMRICHRKLYAMMVDRSIGATFSKASSEELASAVKKKFDQKGKEAVMGRLFKKEKLDQFDKADKDGNKELDIKELEDLFRNEGIKLTTEALEDIFQSCDTDGSGMIDNIEFEEWLHMHTVTPTSQQETHSKRESTKKKDS